jgi:hypothetical protein
MKQDMSTPGDLIESEAVQFLDEGHGDRACDVARKAARTAKNKRDHREALHFSQVALRIVELKKRKVARDGATPVVGR